MGAAINERFKENGGRKLTIDEVERIVNELAEHPMQKPYLNDARTKMASRDFSFGMRIMVTLQTICKLLLLKSLNDSSVTSLLILTVF